jgi:hypothetical protein
MELEEPAWALTLASKGKRKGEEEEAKGAAGAGGEARAIKAARGKAAAAAAASGGSGGGGGKGDVHKELVKILAKLCLTNATEIRDISGVIYITYLVKKESSICEAMKEAGVKYDDAVQGNPTHNLGPPFLHVWIAMIKAMVQLKDMEVAHKELLIKYWNDTIMKKTMDELITSVSYCRLKKTMKPEIVKVQYCLTIQSEYTGMGQAIAAAWKLEKADLKIGPAPRGILEREARRLLTKLE